MRRGAVTVVGSLNADLSVDVARLPAEGETVIAATSRSGPGGKGLNQAVAAARQGAEVRMVGAVGDDPAGADLLAVLAREGIDGAGVAVVPGVPTGMALVTVAAGGANTIVVAAGANATELGPLDLGEPAPAVVLTQMEIRPEVVEAALRAAAAVGALAVLNPAPAAGPLPVSTLAAADLVIPNETEALRLTGEADPAAAAAALRGAGCGAVVVTLGSKGALLVDASGTRTVDAFAVDAADTTAAGDAFCGTLAAALAAGRDLDSAARLACAAGALAATRPGAVDSLPAAGPTRDLAGDDAWG